MFGLYTVMLMVSGLLLVGLGLGVRDLSVLMRVINVLVGLGFFGYGFYLEFVFTGGQYAIFFYAFILPVLLIARSVRGRARRRARIAASPVYNLPPQPRYPLGPGLSQLPPASAGVPHPEPAQAHSPAQRQPGYVAQHSYRAPDQTS